MGVADDADPPSRQRRVNRAADDERREVAGAELIELQASLRVSGPVVDRVTARLSNERAVEADAAWTLTVARQTRTAAIVPAAGNRDRYLRGQANLGTAEEIKTPPYDCLSCLTARSLSPACSHSA